MDFKLDELQVLLRDSAQRWMRERYDQPHRAAARTSPLGYSTENWAEMAEFGWLGMLAPEAQGGLERPIADAAVVAEELGRRLCLEPFSAVAGGAVRLLAAGPPDARTDQWLSDLTAGGLIVGVAHGERDARGRTSFVQTRAERTAGGWRLNGLKSLVQPAGGMGLILVSARTDGEAGSPEGISLFALAPDTHGVTLSDYPTIDGGRACDLSLKDVELGPDALVGAPGQAFEALEQAMAATIILTCAEAVGFMDEAVWATRDYLKSREQFGGPIARFQVLQHRCADMYIETAVARAALWRALALADDPDPNLRRQAFRSAKARVGQSARFVCSQAIQLHGGIGVTEEYSIGHYFKRMAMFDALHGSAADHLRLLAEDGIQAPSNI
jgi:alkylation response protein AidB-like acyl-CoA dehydrogenase